MLFTELRFLPFLLVVLALHWGLRSARARKLVLLLASWLFYAAWDWRFLSLIWFSTALDYAVGLALGREERPGRRRLWLLASLVGNLGLLGVFKYANFFLDSAVRLLSWVGVEAHVPTLAIVLPVGISFYTFQTLSYSIDVYRRNLAPTRSALDLALFVAFFPQLVAGPIVRAVDFLPQLREPRRWAAVDVRGALTLFLIGYVQKAVVADGVAPAVDWYFSSPGSFDGPSAFLGTLLYAAQIYGDFCGYSNMAIACAALLGYRLCDNFAFPYLARNASEFWRRWHISLSSWFRDYLYVPLGGNRGSPLATARNLMVTMLVAGLWHGAAWTFVVWGGLHGLALLVHRLWARKLAPALGLHLPAPLGVLLTFWWVCLAWIFFRARGFDDALSIARAWLGLGGPCELSLGDRLHWVLLALAAVHLVSWSGILRRPWERLPAWAFALLYGALWALALRYSQAESKPFLYFQF